MLSLDTCLVPWTWSTKLPPPRLNQIRKLEKFPSRCSLSSLNPSKLNNMKRHPKEERTLILIKPDALQRHLLGEIIHRFERKGLNIIGLKMLFMDSELMQEHYGKYADKPFFKGLVGHMSKSPIVALAGSGIKAISVTRLIVGQTEGYE